MIYFFGVLAFVSMCMLSGIQDQLLSISCELTNIRVALGRKRK